MNEPTLTPIDTKAVLRPGQVVGETYRVDGLLAEGGMAAVWAGVNQRTGKRVALKVILPTFAENGEAMAMFRREALAASKVNHPNVVSIFDVIEHEGMTCIVMERLEGETLGVYLAERGPLGLDEAVALLLPAMRGVAAANTMGVVHRDLKPGNIFLCKDPDGRLLTTKVLDFGVSVFAERAASSPVREASSDDSSKTTALTRFGTPAYMAPEDIEGSSNIDCRADVYGFGVLLFEVLTGQVPFPGEPNEALFTRIVTEAPPKIADLRSDLPSTVQFILDSTLAKDPHERFPDVEQLIRAIEEHLPPNLPVQRSLSPIAGVAIMPLMDGAGSGLHRLAWVAPNREPAQQGTTDETRVMYRVSDDSSLTPVVTVTAERRTSKPTPHAPHARRLVRQVMQLPGVRMLRDKRIGVAAALVGFTVILPWFVFREPPKLPNKPAQAASMARGQDVNRRTPLPSTQSAPLPPGRVAPVIGVPRDLARPTLGQGDADFADDRGIQSIVPLRPYRAAAPAAEREAVQKVPERRRAHRSRAAFAPRAGRLTPADF
jgi:serine/threonine protein kinase